MKIYQVDTFTNEPFKGNPAAVCLLSQAADDIWMQNIALEMNLSETAFVLREGDGFRLRWMTPEVEVDLCGHATLAAAHILFSECMFKYDEVIRFFTRSGELRAWNREGLIWLDLPATIPQPFNPPEDLLSLLACDIVDAAQNSSDWLIQISDPKVLRSIKPNFATLSEHPPRGIILTSHSDIEGYDFISRFFAPSIGINEDAVTGSAHVLLAPYWRSKLHVERFFAWQASKRGGELRLLLHENRVQIGGHALTVFNVDLKPPALEHPLP